MTTELFAYLVGICSLTWCSFYTIHYDEELYLMVRAYDQQADIISEKLFQINELSECEIIIKGIDSE